MVNVVYSPSFKKKVSKIKDGDLKQRVIKLIEKLVNLPELGKPMRYERKGTREVYLKPFRLAYSYLKDEDKIYFLDLYHKDEQ